MVTLRITAGDALVSLAITHTPKDSSSTHPIIHHSTHLLDVRGEAEERLRIREDGAALVAQKGRVPKPEQAHQQGDVLAGGRGGEVLVHVARSRQELLQRLCVHQRRERGDVDMGDANRCTHKGSDRQTPVVPSPSLLLLSLHSLLFQTDRRRALSLSFASSPSSTSTRLEAEDEGEGQHAHGGGDRVAAPDPVPEAEDVVGVDAELCVLFVL